MANKIAYKASSKHGSVIESTPRKAAQAFFTKFPSARKCDIIQGEDDGPFFVVKFTLTNKSTWPTSYKDIGKKAIDSLSDTNPQDVVQA